MSRYLLAAVLIVGCSSPKDARIAELEKQLADKQAERERPLERVAELEEQLAVAEARAVAAETALAAAAEIAEPPDAPFVPMDQPADVEGVQVRVMAAQIKPMTLVYKDGSGEVNDTVDSLLLAIEIGNTTERRKVDYYGWPWETDTPHEEMPVLTDDAGNRYSPSALLSKFTIPGRCGTAKLHPGEAVMDVLPFEPPIAAAKTLYLTLPGIRAGVEKDFRIEIPMSAVKRPAQPAPKPRLRT